MKKVKSYDSVWDALADSPEQAANLRARAELMQQIAAIVKKRGWTQVEARVIVASPSRESIICCAVAYLASRSTRLSTLRLPLVAASTLNWSPHKYRRSLHSHRRSLHSNLAEKKSRRQTLILNRGFNSRFGLIGCQVAQP